ncbi:MAG TPA: hypothetical protein VJ998_12020 [Pseudomonadales bacterium]|nr:hypothetical protein [Pseudomonadales bacterium]
MTRYVVSRIKDSTRANNVAAARTANEIVKPALTANSINLFGVFAPLFGLASNELYLVSYAEAPHSVADVVAGAGIDLIESIDLVPTVRPVEAAPRTRPGIYVFRWFDVYNRDVDEIADLSRQAWVTFEGDFDTQVQALFAEPERGGERGTMLLITWYTDFSVWEASRRPSAEARDNFMRRAQLTIEAKPIATRLILPD